MKNLVLTMALTASVAAFGEENKATYVDPNPYADYTLAMKSTTEQPLAAVWSKGADPAIAEATSEDALAAVVADAASADALLAKLRPAYETDPIVLTQFAAVTQWVMLPDPCFIFFWKPFPSRGRAVWTAALERKIAESKDQYVRILCRQQLDLCK